MNEVDALRAILGYLAGIAGGTPIPVTQGAGSGAAYGANSATLESGTTALTGLRAGAITMLSDTVFSTLTGMAGDSVGGVTFPKGVTIYGQFTAITLTSGSIVFYQ